VSSNINLFSIYARQELPVPRDRREQGGSVRAVRHAGARRCQGQVWSRNDGGAPVRGYFVERRSGGKWIRVNKEAVDQLHFTVRDLIQGSDYQFRVCAVNIEGKCRELF